MTNKNFVFLSMNGISIKNWKCKRIFNLKCKVNFKMFNLKCKVNFKMFYHILITNIYKYILFFKNFELDAIEPFKLYLTRWLLYFWFIVFWKGIENESSLNVSYSFFLPPHFLQLASIANSESSPKNTSFLLFWKNYGLSVYLKST